jgi:hypothetical protein
MTSCATAESLARNARKTPKDLLLHPDGRRRSLMRHLPRPAAPTNARTSRCWASRGGPVVELGLHLNPAVATVRPRWLNNVDCGMGTA